MKRKTKQVRVIYKGPYEALVVESLGITIRRGEPIDLPVAFFEERKRNDPAGAWEEFTAKTKEKKEEVV